MKFATIAFSAAVLLGADNANGQQESALPSRTSEGYDSNVNDGMVTFFGYVNVHVYAKTIPYTLSPNGIPCELSHYRDAMYNWDELDAAWRAAVAANEEYDWVGESVGIPCSSSANIGSYYRQEGPNGEEGVVQTIDYQIRYDTGISNFTGPFIDFDAVTAEVFANNSFLPVLLACDTGGGCNSLPYDCPPNLFENATAALHVGIEEPDCPTRRPTEMPTAVPTSRPTLSMPPTNGPSASPSVAPTASPSESPSMMPSSSPTEVPSGVARANSAAAFAIGAVMAGLASFLPLI